MHLTHLVPGPGIWYLAFVTAMRTGLRGAGRGVQPGSRWRRTGDGEWFAVLMGRDMMSLLTDAAGVAFMRLRWKYKLCSA